MLLELRISNFALLDQLHIALSPGFIVFTGETGAGKSLLIDALIVLMGGRASMEHIKAGTQEAVLEARFSLPSRGAIVDCLRDLDLLGEEPQALLLRRVLSRSGRNRAYVNGHFVPIQTLQTLAPFLIDFHGQHEQQSLLSPTFQVSVLDEFAGLAPLCSRYREARTTWLQKKEALETAHARLTALQREQEILEFQFNELSRAQLEAGEEDALTAEYTRLQHAEKIADRVEHAYQLLYGADASILEQLRRASQCIREAAALDPRLADWTAIGESVSIQLRDLARELRGYRETIEYDDRRLGVIDERLATLQHLKNKYRTDVPGLIDLREQLRRRLHEWEEGDHRLNVLQKDLDDARHQVNRLAQELSRQRRAAANEFERKVMQELKSLAMDAIAFKVAIDSQTEGDEGLGPTGWDRVEYLFSVNPGSPMYPLAKIASGGELSRIMLAMKTVLAASDKVPTLIFDEIDVGIGGAVATLMGKRLRALARYHQVLCVTHLPQIASQADQHFSVQKRQAPDRTQIQVSVLEDEIRQEEIARMLGGLEVTRSVRQSAAEMLESRRRRTRRAR